MWSFLFFVLQRINDGVPSNDSMEATDFNDDLIDLDDLLDDDTFMPTAT